MADDRTARRSSSVIPEGTPITTRGLMRKTRFAVTCIRKCRSIISVTSTSAMTLTTRCPSVRWMAEYPRPRLTA